MVHSTAQWSHFVKLYQLESGPGVKLLKLNEIAVAQNLWEGSLYHLFCQFCDEAVAALRNDSEMKNEGVEDTTVFISSVITFEKILHVKSLGEDIRLNDPLRAVIADPADSFIYAMCKKMVSSSGKRVKQLTKDTAVYQTCNGLVELTRCLLSTTHYTQMSFLES